MDKNTTTAWALTEAETLCPLTDQPIARTNILKMEGDPESILLKLLASTPSQQFVIDFGIRQLKQEPRENSENFFKRLHQEIKVYLHQKLELKNKIAINYELIRIDNGEYVFFYVDQPVIGVSIAETQKNITSRVKNLSQRLSANEVNPSRLIQALFSLQLKIALLSQTSEYLNVRPAYWNSSLYLNVQLTKTLNKKTGNGVVEAFDVDVFCSDQLEIVITLHKCKFLVTRAETTVIPLDAMDVMFDIDSSILQTKRRLDARESTLPFFRDQSGYGTSQAYTYNLVMNYAITQLDNLAIPFQETTFQAQYEVNHFFKGEDFQLKNIFYIVDTGLTLSKAQRKYLYAELRRSFPQYHTLSLDDFIKKQQETQPVAGRFYLVLNPVINGETSSIVNVLNSKERKVYPTFFAAYADYKKGKAENLDIYTCCKIKQFENNLNGTASDVVLQGFNVDEKFLFALDYITELKSNDSVKFTADKSNSKSKLYKSIHQVQGKIKRTKTELWLKEVSINKKPIEIGVELDGDYTAYYARKPKNQDYFLAHITFTVSSGKLTIKNRAMSTGKDLDWLSVEHPVLERLDKLYNDSFYLHCHESDQFLTAYHSLRIPKIIGNTAFDPVDLYAYQEQKKSRATDEGKKFNTNDYEITRSAKPKKTVLPYYLVSGRRKADPLQYSNKLKHHHIYLMPHSEGTYVLITAAQPANQTLARQSLMKNIIIIDSSNKKIDPMQSKLSYAYLHSFTVDLLKNNESAKTSLFEKLAKLVIEN